jgi:protocatechuate 3,4-dioxygenase beta subunit
VSKQITGSHAKPTEKASFLRGIQISDENGKVTFQTIYPGWYKFRTLHVHLMVTKNERSLYTGEIYFTDDMTDKVAKVEPYNTRSDERVRNMEDWQFEEENGMDMIMNPTGDTQTGLQGSKDIVINLNSRGFEL